MQIPSFAFYAIFLLHLGLALATPLLQHQVEALGSTIETTHSQHQRRQSSSETFVVTGVASAGVHPRLELRAMQDDADLWNLYILGLRRFYDTDQDDKLSFYQISGERYGVGVVSLNGSILITSRHPRPTLWKLGQCTTR